MDKLLQHLKFMLQKLLAKTESKAYARTHQLQQSKTKQLKAMQ